MTEGRSTYTGDCPGGKVAENGSNSSHEDMAVVAAEK
jgi:hypothetical protein